MAKSPVQVSDALAERRELWSNIIQFLILAVMTWVGTNIHTMKNDISEIKKSDAVQAAELIHIKEKVDYHITNDKIHNIRYGDNQ